jgi:hypothetical protein
MRQTDENSQRALWALEPTPVEWLEAIHWTMAAEKSVVDQEAGPAAHAVNPEIRAVRRRLHRN